MPFRIFSHEAPMAFVSIYVFSDTCEYRCNQYCWFVIFSVFCFLQKLWSNAWLEKHDSNYSVVRVYVLWAY